MQAYTGEASDQFVEETSVFATLGVKNAISISWKGVFLLQRMCKARKVVYFLRVWMIESMCNRVLGGILLNHALQAIFYSYRNQKKILLVLVVAIQCHSMKVLTYTNEGEKELYQWQILLIFLLEMIAGTVKDASRQSN